ncbi:MAG: bifunctional riboflavin kinase/FAD synthetase [Anaerolineae bacterium]|nr:bifunctional riboflavin kinase/FAD synthetase [Anaerolineae bacterium]
MHHYYDLSQAHLDQPSVVTIGVFDGVHRGHQYLIRRLVAEARAQDKLAVALTFFPHPDVVLRHLEGRYYLTTPEERARLLGELGIDYVITQTFDESFRHIRAAHYVEMLQRHLHLSSLWVGADFALGYQREGNVTFLKEQGKSLGFEVDVIDLIVSNHDDMAINSTGIRAALLEGDIERANRWLGRPYILEGEVVHGEKRGRQIGFPTANIDVWDKMVIPANGVYAGWAHVGDERHMAVTNIGVRPTFNGSDVTVEAHLIDFNGDLYGQQLSLTFEKRLRPEKKFNGIQELIAQIGADVEDGRAYLSQQA